MKIVLVFNSKRKNFKYTLMAKKEESFLCSAKSIILRFSQSHSAPDDSWFMFRCFLQYFSVLALAISRFFVSDPAEIYCMMRLYFSSTRSHGWYQFSNENRQNHVAQSRWSSLSNESFFKANQCRRYDKKVRTQWFMKLFSAFSTRFIESHDL